MVPSGSYPPGELVQLRVYDHQYPQDKPLLTSVNWQHILCGVGGY